MKYYIYAEDLGAGLIGPFDSETDAAAHIDFCRERGDDDPGRVVTEDEANAKRIAYSVTTGYSLFEMTPEADRAFKCPE